MQKPSAAKHASALLLIALSFQAFIYADCVHAQTITSGPTDLSPYKSISLKGSNFGQGPGKFHIRFRPPSLVQFPNGSPSDLTLDAAQNGWNPPADRRMEQNGPSDIVSTPIRVASPIGAVSEQTVDITMTTADGKTSNVWHAKFHNEAVITQGPTTVRPNNSFNLAGWDFGEEGTLKVHFPTQNPTNRSSLDLTLSITGGWKPWAINTKMPLVQGVVEQTVDITFTTKDGRRSNTWKAKFIPMMDFKQLTWQDVTVVNCSNQSEQDVCNHPGLNSGNCAGPSLNTWGEFDKTDDSLNGSHYGCWGFSSDDGVDIYSVRLKNGWTIERFFGFPLAVDRSSVNYSTVPGLPANPPATTLIVNVSWDIGSDGGQLFYGGDIVIKGPIGVPYE